MAGKSTEKVRKILCYYCDRELPTTNFYVASDPMNKVGYANICKECCEKIARNYNDKTGQYDGETEQSMKEALVRLDRPWLKSMFQTAVQVSQDGTNTQKGIKRQLTIWHAYIQQMNLPRYRFMRWVDGEGVYGSPHQTRADVISKTPNEADEMYVNNRNDIVRLVGYDPFINESEDDKPLLYAQLVGFLDSEGNNDDMTRVLDSIEIVRAYAQMQKLGDAISKSITTLAETGNSSMIKINVDTKKKLTDVITQLAEQSCIALKHSKSTKKGENTWTGKIKKLKDLNLREAEVNGFDIGTCRGMQQVIDMSNASILKQLHLDESEYSDMIAEQRQKLTDLNRDVDTYKELVRLLLRENLDLKDTLSDNGVIIEKDLIDLQQLISPFSEVDDEEEDADEDDAEDSE